MAQPRETPTAFTWLLASLSDYGRGESPTRGTSMHVPKVLIDPVDAARELSWEPSSKGGTFTDAAMDAVAVAVAVAELHRFARRRALADHVATFPSDIPSLADAASHCASGTGHPASAHPDVVRRVADRYASEDPSWAVDGRADAAIDAALSFADTVIAILDEMSSMGATAAS